MKTVWLKKALALLLIAAAVHVLAIWALPRLIMHRVMHGPIAASIGGWNKPAFPAQADSGSRTIVAPNPDLLYALCLIDLRQGPVHVSADPQLNSYWSIALYASNSDNFFVLNDKAAAGRPVSFWIDTANAANTAPAVISPSATALLLMRVLANNQAKDFERLDAARKTLRCEPGAS